MMLALLRRTFSGLCSERKLTVLNSVRRIRWGVCFPLMVACLGWTLVFAQDGDPQPEPPIPTTKTPEFDLYGFAMLDAGYDFGQIDPNWFDVERPTKLPAFPNEFGQNGNFFTGVRQTRFGVQALVPTKRGELKTVF